MPFPVADGHCDYLYGMVQSGFDLVNKKRDQIIALSDMEEGHVAMQFFAAWIDTTLRVPPMHQCVAMIDAYYRMLEKTPALTPFTKEFDPSSGKIATVLAVEGGEALDGSLAALRTFYRLGVRAMTLTWNENNELCGAATAKSMRGLTSLGKETVDEMCRLGIAIDVSHTSDRGIDDILARATRPIFASHSNARSVCDSPRALKDEHIREITKRVGVVGVNFFHKQLCDGESACIEDIVRHIKHIASVGGVRCCAIGSDFDGMTRYPRDLKSSKDFPRLGRALQMSGFSDADVSRILYQNLHDYIVQFV